MCEVFQESYLEFRRYGANTSSVRATFGVTFRLGVFNLCSAHGLNQVDMTIVCEIFSELDQGYRVDIN